MNVCEPDVPATLVTVTFAAPALPFGRVHVADVAEDTLTLEHAEPPTATVIGETKPVPVNVNVPGDVSGPADGETDPNVGTAT